MEIHYSDLSLLLSHSPKPFIIITFGLINDVGSLLISQQSTESPPLLAPVPSGAQPKIQLCQMKYCLPSVSEWMEAAEGEGLFQYSHFTHAYLVLYGQPQASNNYE